MEAGEKALAEGKDVELPSDVPQELLSQLKVEQRVASVVEPGQGPATVRKINIVLDKGAPTPFALAASD